MAPSFMPHFDFLFLKEGFWRNTNLIPRDLYQSSEAPAAGSKGKIDSNAWVKWCLNYNRDYWCILVSLRLIPVVISTYKDRQSWLDRRRFREPRIRKHEVNNFSNLHWVVFLKTWKRASLASMASCCTYNLTVLQDGKVYESLPFFDTLKCATRSQKILWTCQVANLLIVLRVGTVVVAVGPEPQLKQKST